MLNLKRIVFTIGLILAFQLSHSQQPFIKTIDYPGYGGRLRILPTADLGWVILSKDSLKLTKFNRCGYPEWSKKYSIPNLSGSLCDFISLSNGNFTLLTTADNGSIHVSLITTLDANGNVIWSKSYEDTYYDQFTYTIGSDKQGNLVVFAGLDHVNNNPSYSLAFKVDPNGNILWSKIYDHGGIWGGAIVTDDNGVLMRTGSTFIKTDQAGQLQWTSEFYTPTYYYLAPVEVADGYIFTGYTNPTNYICFYKMDKQGNLLWNGFKKTNLIGYPPVFHKKTSGNITGVFNSSTVIEFDKDMQIVQKSSWSGPGTGIDLYGKDICFLPDNTPVLAGTTSSVPFFMKMDKKYNTSCSILSQDISDSIKPLTGPVNGTNLLSYNLTVVNHNFTSDTFSVDVSEVCKIPKLLELGPDTFSCKDILIFLKNQTGDVFDHYLWSTGDTTTILPANESGTYWVKAYDDCSEEVWQDTIEVVVFPAVQAGLGDDLLMCESIPLVLFAPVCDSCSFTWNTGSHADSITIENEGSYWLTVVNTNGCSSTDTLSVDEVKCDCTFYIPNAFTPNDDGRNETFRPLYDCEIRNYSFRIFNRWGEKVFGTTDEYQGWYGKHKGARVTEGVYIYVINYTPVLKGKMENSITRSGSVTVMY